MIFTGGENASVYNITSGEKYIYYNQSCDKFLQVYKIMNSQKKVWQCCEYFRVPMRYPSLL